MYVARSILLPNADCPPVVVRMYMQQIAHDWLFNPDTGNIASIEDVDRWLTYLQIFAHDTYRTLTAEVQTEFLATANGPRVA